MASTPGQRTDGVRDCRHPDWHDHGLAASSEGGKTRIEEACEDSAHDFAYAKIGSSEAIEGATAAAMCNLPAARVRQVKFCGKFCGCCATKPRKRYTQRPCFPRAQPHSESATATMGRCGRAVGWPRLHSPLCISPVRPKALVNLHNGPQFWRFSHPRLVQL